MHASPYSRFCCMSVFPVSRYLKTLKLFHYAQIMTGSHRGRDDDARNKAGTNGRVTVTSGPELIHSNTIVTRPALLDIFPPDAATSPDASRM